VEDRQSITPDTCAKIEQHIRTCSFCRESLESISFLYSDQELQDLMDSGKIEAFRERVDTGAGSSRIIRFHSFTNTRSERSQVLSRLAAASSSRPRFEGIQTWQADSERIILHLSADMREAGFVASLMSDEDQNVACAALRFAPHRTLFHTDMHGQVRLPDGLRREEMEAPEIILPSMNHDCTEAEIDELRVGMNVILYLEEIMIRAVYAVQASALSLHLHGEFEDKHEFALYAPDPIPGTREGSVVHFPIDNIPDRVRIVMYMDREGDPSQ
jgi:hypothetical protein